MEKFIVAINSKTDPSNQSSQQTIEEAVNYLAETYAKSIKEDCKIINVLGGLEKDALKTVIEFYLKDKLSNVEMQYIRNDLELLRSKTITHVIFNRNETSPGPIIILDKRILVMPGELPEKLYYKNCKQ